MISLHNNFNDGLPAGMLIGLIGLAGSGKDTCASMLEPLGFAQLAFADPLRAEVCSAWGLDERHVTDRVLKHTLLAALAIVNCHNSGFIARMEALGHDLQAPRSPRWLMQHWGTEFRRHQDPCYWIDQTVWRIAQLRGKGLRRIVVSDVRMQDEVDCLTVLGGHFMRIDSNRTDAHMDAAARAHVSEQLPEAPGARLVLNHGSLKQLEVELVRALDDIASAMRLGETLASGVQP